MTAQIIVLSAYRKAKAKTEPKEMTYAEWLRFWGDPTGFWRKHFLEAAARRNRTEGDER